jgi:signal transduction histidine kinase
MASAPEVSSSQLEENLWIEIVQSMESLYANLAQTQADAEKKNQELLEAKAFTDNIIGSMVSSLVVTDWSSVITLANEGCCRLLGYDREELVGRPLATILAEGAPNPVGASDGRREPVAPASRAPGRLGSGLWSRLRLTGSATELETVLRTKGGTEIPVSLHVSVLRDSAGEMSAVVLVATDMREAKRLLEEARSSAAAERQQAAERASAYRELKALQARLIQSEKMSSLGRMAASVAHEINNPLGGIIVYSHLLLENTPEDFPGRANLEKIVREAIRCRDIVRGLLDFARPEPGARRSADLNAIIHAAHDLVKGQAVFKEIGVRLELSPTPLESDCDASQLEQAFTNILVNAAEAISGQGTITIHSWYDAEQDMAAASFTDTGCGIPPGDLERIFEPFFTSKREGHGTGLGLAIVYRIVERHSGTVKVESTAGRGTTFTVRLPAKATTRSTA